MKQFKNSVLATILKVIGALMIIPLILVLIVLFAGYGSVYETNSVNDYLHITGNFVNEEPKAFIQSFFPEKIEDSFSEVDYHYKAKRGDGYAYECYLEFVIEDAEQYAAYVAETLPQIQSNVFSYDDTFMEKSVSNVLLLEESVTGKAGYSIGNAELGKILYSDRQQRIIYVAVGMHDGGGTTTEELGHFFTRFQVDPWEYAKTAYASGYYQERGITNQERSGDGSAS